MKPIKLTDTLIRQLRDEIMAEIEKKYSVDAVKKDAEDSLKKLSMNDGKFKFSRDFKFEKNFSYEETGRRAKIVIGDAAYGKMMTLVMSQPKEIGWHGVVRRTGKDEYYVEDILIYPQKVTAATVDTDEEEYTKWMISIDDAVFPDMHFHGHSHVDMGVSPSSTDMNHRQKIVNQLRDEDFYVFMIWNKRLEWSAAVYDMATNTLFETKDIDVEVELGGTTAGQLLAEVKERVVEERYVAPAPATTNKYPIYDSGKQQTSKKGGAGVGNDPDDFLGGYEYGYGYRRWW